MARSRAKSVAERQRAWRDRQRRSTHVVPVEISDYEIERMIDQGQIDEQRSADRKQLAMAVGLIFRNALLTHAPEIDLPSPHSVPERINDVDENTQRHAASRRQQL